MRSSLRTIRLSHIVLQFSDYRDTETQTRICKESHGEKSSTNSNCARATSRSFLSERAVGQVNFQGVSRNKEGRAAKGNRETETLDKGRKWMTNRERDKVREKGTKKKEAGGEYKGRGFIELAGSL